MAPRAPTPGQLANARPVYCLDFSWDGVVYRVATHPIDIVRADSTVLHYTEALSEPEFSDEVSREGIQESASVPLALYLDGVDIAEREARGARLESAEGHLFMVLMDQDTNRAGQVQSRVFPILTGRLSRPVRADPERDPGYLAFTLESDPGDDASLLLDPEAVINTTTWSAAPSTSNGKVYPVVIGTPGNFRRASGTASTTSGSPAYTITVSGGDATKLLIAGHEVEASSVTIFDEDGDDESFSVEHETDGLGRTVAVVNIGTPGTLDPTDREFWVCWNNGGGLRSPFGPDALTGLGDVCAWALLRSSLPVDIESWVAEAGLLNRIEVATYINQAALSPWSFVARLLDDLFVEVRPGPLGLYPLSRWLDRAMAEGLMLITEGPDMEPAGPRIDQTQLSEVINQSTVRFAPRARTGDFKRTVTVTPDADPDDPEAFEDEYATISANRWTVDPDEQVIRAESIDLPHIYDDASAALIARERIRVQGLGYSRRAYTGSPEFGALQAGDQFRFESASLHRTFLATVGAMQWTGSAWAFSLFLDEDPIRISSLKKSGA